MRDNKRGTIEDPAFAALVEEATRKPLTYGDLVDAPYGAFIYCDECDAGADNGFSATRGDYYFSADDDPVICGRCNGPMSLGVQHRTVEKLK